MGDVRYMISDASKKVGVEAHVLRYWEEELELPIMRNEMGHRYYTEENIRHLIRVKEMKEKGFQLKAIRMAFDNHMENAEELAASVIRKPVGDDMKNMEPPQEQEKENEQGAEIEHRQANPPQEQEEAKKARQLQARQLFKELFLQALQENNQILLNSVKEEVGDHVIKQVDYLFREQEEREEERFKRFDELLRKKQRGKLGLRLKSHSKRQPSGQKA